MAVLQSVNKKILSAADFLTASRLYCANLLLALVYFSVQEVYLTEKQAKDIVFKGCDAVISKDIKLSEDVYKKVCDELKRTDIEKKHTLFLGLKEGKVVSIAVIVDEIGKFQPITFIVCVDAKGSVRDVLIMVYREHIGSDVKKPWWLKEFKDKKITDPIKRDRDILKLSGATLSCDAVARGVRKVLTIVDQIGKENPKFFESIQMGDYELKRYVMGTICTISTFDEELEKSKGAVEDAFNEIKKWDEILSNYSPKSELSQLSNGKTVSKEMEFFIKESLKYSLKTDGAFDVTIEPLVMTWGFYDKSFRVPQNEELDRVKSLIGFQNLQLNSGKLKIPEGMKLDAGAIGKGIAVDFAAAVLRKKGIAKFCIDFGSTILCSGIEVKAVIKNPFDEKKPLGIVKLKDMSLSTSGSYEKYFEKDGRKYCHILDPKTLKPVNGVASVTTISQSATESDAMSTAVFVSKKLKWVDAMIVFDDKKIDMTEGFKKVYETVK